MANVLVLAEHQNGKLPKQTLVAFTAGKQAAAKLGGECHAVVLGKGVAAVAAEVAQYGVTKVYVVEDDSLSPYVADAHAAALAQVVKDKGAEMLLATATAVGKDLLPRVAALLGAGMAGEVTAFNDDGTMIRPMFAGNALATVSIEGSPKVVSVRATAFDPAAKGGSGAVEQVTATIDAGAKKTKYASFSETKSDRPVLTDARIVVSGGRALKSGENFKTVLEPLVDELGAAMGASRAAVDAGYVPNDLQVGQTGKVVDPELYIAVGISGAI
ncbi:MAG TPA: electron transfer flavoprotein subunit alpha/FixB family protein, partial [Terriglobales bacterium]|nr:electron transfer flavoprotein subunit alpha/FixB family protein [Terriglobales bacterium]